MDFIDDLYNKRPNHLLYHYTSQAGLLGILLKKEIWASKVHYLNDSEEFRYAYKRLKDRLKKRKGEPFDEIPRWVENEYVNIFVCSFTKEGDLLSQWRAYCPPGGGYGIGFKSKYLCSCAEHGQFELGKCIYDQKIQDGLIDDLLDRTLEYYKKNGASGWEGMSGPMKVQFYRLACLFKHRTFYEEQEWRLVSPAKPLIQYCNDRVSFREGKSMIVPFYGLPLIGGKDSDCVQVSEIIIGPTPHPELARHSIWGILSKIDSQLITDLLLEEKVRNSQIPYRAW